MQIGQPFAAAKLLCSFAKSQLETVKAELRPNQKINGTNLSVSCTSVRIQSLKSCIHVQIEQPSAAAKLLCKITTGDSEGRVEAKSKNKLMAQICQYHVHQYTYNS